MKNVLNSIIALFICFTTVNVQAQSHVLKTNLLGPLAGQYQLVYEHSLSTHFSAQLSAGYLAGQSEGSSIINGDSYSYDSKRSGFIIIPEVRWYPAGNGPEGLFVGAFGRMRQANNDLSDNSQSTATTGVGQNLSRENKVSSIGGGAVLGFQWISKGGVSFDIFAGPSYKSRSTETTYDTASLNESATNTDYDNLGDELFNQKFLDFKLQDSDGWGLRFGFHLGYAF